MQRPRHPRRLRVIGSLAVGIAAVTTALGTAQPGSAATTGAHPLRGAAARQSALRNFLNAGKPGMASRAVTKTTPTNTHQGDDGDLAATMAAYNAERTAPAGYLTGDAIGAAAQQAAQIPSTPGSWQQFTTQAYNGQPAELHRPVLVERRRRLLRRRRPGHGAGDHAGRRLVRGRGGRRRVALL